MKKNYINKATLDEIVFEGRNKSYGAYLLRKLYPRNVLTGMFLSVGIFTFGVGGPVAYNSFAPEEIEEEVVIEIEAELTPIESIDPETPPPPPVPEIEPPKINTVRFTPPEIKPDEEVKKEDLPPVQNDLDSAVAASETQEGNATDTDAIIEVVTAPDITGEKEEVWVGSVQAEAEFPGGLSAMKSYFIDNIRAPRKISEGISKGGMVVIFAEIDKDGSVRKASVAKGISDCEECNAEALRLVKSMPNWSPAKVNGRAVIRKKTIPIEIR